MKILSTLLIFYYLTLTNCRSIERQENGNRPLTTITSITAEETHNRPIFPKNVKFIVNIRRGTEKSSTVQDVTTKRPVMPKLVVTFKKEEGSKHVEPLTRRPLMKLRTYTIKQISNNNPNENRDKILNIRTEIKFNDSVNVKGIIRKPIDDSLEEAKDRREFIFMNRRKTEKISRHDMLQDTHKDYDTTVAAEYKDVRAKRSINIIEEENIGTTISSLKYTGRDTNLYSDVSYKNVNS